MFEKKITFLKEIRKTVLYVDFSKTNFVLQIVLVKIQYIEVFLKTWKKFIKIKKNPKCGCNKTILT